MSIAPSELIISPRGSIYHLDLQPEELADTIIIVGDPGRVAMVSKYFDRIEFQRAHREFIAHTGYIGQKRLTVLSTGIGPDNIDIVLTELDALANIDFKTREVKAARQSLTIIRLGTCGALQGDLPVDGCIASSFGLGLDNLMHYYRQEVNPDESFILRDFIAHARLETTPIKPYIAEGSIGLRAAFADKMATGITVTCPGFYGPQGRMLRLPLALPHLIDALGTFSSRGHRVTNFEMETSAIYGLGKLLGHHVLSISTIVANRVLGTFSKDGKKAVDEMIKLALPIIAGL